MTDHGKEMRDQKSRMLDEQAARRERERPMTDKHQAHFARQLLARLDTIHPNTPRSIEMHGPPAGAFDNIPEKMPEPIGGCFADIAGGDVKGASDDEEEKDDKDHE